MKEITKKNIRHYDGTDLAVLSFILGLCGFGPEFQFLMTFVNMGVNENIGVTDTLDLIILTIEQKHKKLSVGLLYLNRIIALYQIFDSTKDSFFREGDWYINVVLDHSYGQKPHVKGHVEQKHFDTYYNKKNKLKGSKLTHFF